MEWMADFTPIVAAQHKPTEWPAILVLDSVEFKWTDPRTRKSRRLFCILAAYGYDKDGKNGRLWKMEADPHRTGEAWANFLALLPGKPESIVCDSDTAIQAGVDAHWGRNAAVNLIHLCEHHLRQNALDSIESDRARMDDDQLRLMFQRKLRTAFTNADDWEALVAEIRQRPQLMMLNDWLNRVETWVRVQVRVRHQTPPVYSNGALESALVGIRQTIASRAFAFRNRTRMNHLLELIRLSHLQVDNATDYAASIRMHLVAKPAQFTRSYRDIYDPVSDGGTPGFCSLWSISTQKAMRAVRRKPSKPK